MKLQEQYQKWLNEFTEAHGRPSPYESVATFESFEARLKFADLLRMFDESGEQDFAKIEQIYLSIIHDAVARQCAGVTFTHAEMHLLARLYIKYGQLYWECRKDESFLLDMLDRATTFIKLDKRLNGLEATVEYFRLKLLADQGQQLRALQEAKSHLTLVGKKRKSLWNREKYMFHLFLFELYSDNQCYEDAEEHLQEACLALNLLKKANVDDFMPVELMGVVSRYIFEVEDQGMMFVPGEDGPERDRKANYAANVKIQVENAAYYGEAHFDEKYQRDEQILLLKGFLPKKVEGNELIEEECATIVAGALKAGALIETEFGLEVVNPIAGNVMDIAALISGQAGLKRREYYKMWRDKVDGASLYEDHYYVRGEGEDDHLDDGNDYEGMSAKQKELLEYKWSKQFNRSRRLNRNIAKRLRDLLEWN